MATERATVALSSSKVGGLGATQTGEEWRGESKLIILLSKLWALESLSHPY